MYNLECILFCKILLYDILYKVFSIDKVIFCLFHSKSKLVGTSNFLFQNVNNRDFGQTNRDFELAVDLDVTMNV